MFFNTRAWTGFPFAIYYLWPPKGFNVDI